MPHLEKSMGGELSANYGRKNMGFSTLFGMVLE